MYIDFLNESPLWYWYHSGGVIAGLVVTVVLGAIIFGQSNWKTGGISTRKPLKRVRIDTTIG
tara:strand:+ start:367 stop:552 length:186 start_codon:yes stop_codon:yes gene_type:complete